MNKRKRLMAEREIREGVQALTEEMNFRLLCGAGEAELFSGRILWVNNITVTDIVFPKRKKSIFSRMKDIIKRIMQWFKRFVSGMQRR